MVRYVAQSSKGVCICMYLQRYLSIEDRGNKSPGVSAQRYSETYVQGGKGSGQRATMSNSGDLEKVP